MNLRRSAVLLALLPGSMLLAQAPAAAGTSLPSEILRPSMQVLQSALGGVAVDRWKGSAAVRGEASSNLRSIQNDMNATLPTLVTAADAAPGSAAKVLPAYRNVDALYDVLLRVVVSARLYAPADQSSGLDQALNSLEASRRTLGDQLERAAQAQETQIGSLQAALKAVPPPAPPPAPVVCPAPPVKKKTTSRSATKASTAAKPGTAAKP